MTFQIKNCKITVSFLFVAMLALFLFEDKSGIAVPAFLAAMLHEGGHAAMMRLYGTTLSQVRFTPFGIDMVKAGNTDRSYRRDAAISFAGPVVNIAVALICTAFHFEGLTYFISANWVFAVFNLLPIEPLDGGQALYSLLCIKWNTDQAARVVSVVSFAVLTPLAVLGFVTLFHSPGNYSLLLVCAYLMALLILKKGRYY